MTFLFLFDHFLRGKSIISKRTQDAKSVDWVPINLGPKKDKSIQNKSPGGTTKGLRSHTQKKYLKPERQTTTKRRELPTKKIKII